MKKITIGLLLMITVLPQTAGAQFAICEGTVCTACDLVYLANQVITWLVGVLMMVFAVLAVKAGFGLVMSKGNPGELTKAKDSFVNAFVGLLIILSAWLIVDTMIRGLGVKDAQGNPFPWSEVKCQVQVVPDVDRRESPESARLAPAFAGRAADAIDATRARDILRDAGVSVQQGVSLSGISESRVQEIAQMARECEAAMGRSCGIQVSSGVRFPGNPAGVGAHGGGMALDLSARHSPVFNDWMRSQQQSYQRVQSFGGFAGYQVSPSTVCTWEGPDGDSTSAHWHCAPPTR